jgi:hypothetical protein
MRPVSYRMGYDSVEVHLQLSNSRHPMDGKVKPEAAGFTGIGPAA